MTDRLVFAAMLAAGLALAAGRWGIPLLVRFRVAQRIREISDGVALPSQHHGKAGTPTMGGLLLIPAAAVAAVLVAPHAGWPLMLPLLAMIAYGAVGGVDDSLAIRYHRNLGLRARERLLVQGILAACFGVAVMRRPELGTALTLPGLGTVQLGWAYAIFAILYIVGFTNAVNLTDGLDGLAPGTVAIAAGAYAVVAEQLGRPEVAVLAAAVAGACAGFAWFNAHPAAVFMGDTGSNALGAVLAGIALVTKTEWLLFVIGLVFVLEAASVLLQVAYFKATGGRRIFRMSPLHHHFELSGWTETQTVTRFWLISVFAALLGLTLIR